MDNPHSGLHLLASLIFIGFWWGTYNRAISSTSPRWFFIRTVVVGVYHVGTFWDEANFAYSPELIAQFMCWSHWVSVYCSVFHDDIRFRKAI